MIPFISHVRSEEMLAAALLNSQIKLIKSQVSQGLALSCKYHQLLFHKVIVPK